MTIPSIHDAIVIARATDAQIHALGYPMASAARERAAEMLADALQDRIARCNHIINYCADRFGYDHAVDPYLAEIAELARGIAPDATTRAMEAA